MDKSQKQDSLKEMIDILKGDYNLPVKLWVWGKIIKEWAGIIIGIIIFLSIALFIVLAIREAQKEANEKNGAQYAAVLPMKDIVAFMATCQRSINKRQEVLESLMQTIQMYAGRELEKESVEQKLHALSNTLSRCNTNRRIIISEFERASNPFDFPGVHANFMKWVENPYDFFGKNKEFLDSQWENEQWEKLCSLCQNEVKKANNELVQLLKMGTNTQLTGQAEPQEKP
jgi:hypothetical protein